MNEIAPVDRVKSAGRAVDILDRLAQHRGGGLSFTALGQVTGIPKSSLHALLLVLTARKYLEFDEGSRLYSLGLKVWENGQAYLKSRDIVRESRDAMNEVARAVNETVQLARLDGTENLYLAKVDSTHPLRLQSEVGARLSAHATGLGKALLASLTDDEVRRRFAGRPLQLMTGNTITSLDGLVAELARVRRTGFAVDNEEYTPGLFCLAVPIRNHSDQTVAAMSISVPLIRLTLDMLTLGLSLLARSSIEVTRRLGGEESSATLAGLADEKEARRVLVEYCSTSAPMRQILRIENTGGVGAGALPR